MTDKELAIARELAQWAIEAISARRPGAGEIETKAHPADYVTVVDRAVELHVRDVIGERFPLDGIIGEEMGASAGESGRTWYVDPIDGTTNYVFGLPWSSFSLGLADESGPLVGVVADPARAEVISAERGVGAWVGDAPARCAGSATLDGAVLLTEWSAYRPWHGMQRMMTTLAAQGCTVRIMGSAALSLASAAVGRASAAVLGSYNTWDVLAGVLIAGEAGARVLGRDGNELTAIPTANDGGLLVAAPGVADAAWRAWTGLEAS